jgi:hypothetical protein
MHIKFRRGNPALIQAAQAQFVTRHTQSGKLSFEVAEIQTAIKQCADKHIAAHSGKTIKV